MAAYFACLALLLVVSVVREAGGVISGPQFPRNKGLIEPTVLEIPESEGLSELARRSMQDRFRRQVEETEDHIGTLTPLSGDRHTHALVHWTGHPSPDIFILTRKRDSQGRSTESWLWRSDDYGKTFLNDTDKFDNDTVIEWYYISPQQNNLIFADRIHRRLWVTTDEGETYTSYSISFDPDRLIFQSTLAPGSLEGDLPLHVLGYDTTARQLWVSRDLGENWNMLSDNVVPDRYYWRVLEESMEPQTAVYFEVAVNDTISELKWSIQPYQMISNFDESLGQFAVNTFILTHQYMLVQKAALSNASEYSSPLWVSHNRQTFQQAQFPLQTPEKHYSVVDASEGQVFIAVYHSINSTNLYLSEEAGLKYSLSLEYIISPPESAWQARYPTFDVHVVEGIVGTYIANRKAPNTTFGATVISFDKGGEWNQVTPPAADHNNIPIFCVPPECSLHLHMESDRANGYQSILTQDSAIGLIMALGNLGSSLDSSSRRLYFSHDGGFTWQDVEENFWEFQFAALGSIVVTIPKWRPTDYVRWSCDEGSHWNVTNFVDEQIRVVGMLTERGEKANHVTVFGYGRFGFTEWLVIDLNFTHVIPDQCLPEDYYAWIPTDERPGSRCLLGEVVQYERRKSDECCVVDPDYEKPVDRNPCTCTIEDFECDFGFERLHLNSPCTPMPSIVWPPLPPADCLENETYNFTSGYRKVAGDKCVRGNETYFFPIVRDCPVRTPLGLFIQYSPVVVSPEQDVNFILTQSVGSELLTVYLWDFNDTTTVNRTGLEQARLQMHAFALPRVYTVKVTAKNDAGQSGATVDVSVLDSIRSVVLLLPPQYRNGVVPVDTALAFQANFSTEGGTNVVGNVYFIWSYGDSGSAITFFPSTTHTYSAPGTYTFSVAAHNPRGNATTQATITVVQVPHFLNLTASSNQLGAGQTVTFTLQQEPVFTGDTNYTYDYGDDSVDHFSSLASAQTAQHTYSQPGEYVVTVTAFNIAGQIVQHTTITVLDTITNVSISVAQYPDRSVPTGVQVLYKANYNMKFGSELPGSLNFKWDWGDGSQLIQSHTSSFIHVYSDVGTYTLTVTVSNGVSSNSTSVSITTFTFANNVQIKSNGPFFDSGFTSVKQSITLQVTPKSGEVIPANTTFTWNVSGPAGSVIMYTSNPSYDFPEPGGYTVLVMGNYSIGSFSASKAIMAEYQITKLDVSIRQTIHSDARATANLTVSSADDQQYLGPLNLTLLYNGSFQAGTYNLGSSGGVQQLNVGTGNPGVVDIVFRAGNDISGVQKGVSSLVVVGQGQFGSLQLGFKVGSLPDNYTTVQWQADLMNTIIDYLVKKYKLEVWQLEVSILEEIIALPVQTSVKRLHPVLRQTEPEFLLVEINILPKHFDRQEINSTLQVATEIVDMADKKLLNFTVNNQLIVVERAQLSGVVVISPGKDSKNYVALGAGLGGGLIVLVALAIFAIVATIHYRRKYSRLRVRYSRLQQGPVRFTFTPGGQMVEEDEEDEGARETQMESLQSDNDEKPIL